MNTPNRLTKKQKKTLAFRERKTGKRKDRNASFMDAEGSNVVPIMEDQDMADIQGRQLELEVEEKEKSLLENSEEKTKGERGDEQKMEKPKKRQREEDEITMQNRQEEKRAKVLDDNGEIDGKAVAKTQRFILFVGNLKYTTSLEAIQAHFGACDPPPAVRLLTPKTSLVARKPSHRSKGCAFLEFSHRNALLQALKLHQSELEGRMINVELTAGGGGKSENRLLKVRQRNKELLTQRRTRNEKQCTAPDTSQALLDKPQRYSTTSGMAQGLARRTWTVGDSTEGEAHRGGKKHTRARQMSRQTWGTGVNAIPVG